MKKLVVVGCAVALLAVSGLANARSWEVIAAEQEAMRGIAAADNVIIAGSSNNSSNSDNTNNTIKPPQVIEMDNIPPGEVRFNMLERSIKPKINIPIHKTSDENSEIVGNMPANVLAKVSAVLTRCFPYRNITTIDGKTAYILMYRGEGYYNYWQDGEILEKDMRTNQIDPKSVFWVKVNSDGVEGWFLPANYEMEKFYRDLGSGIFLNPQYSNNWR